VWSRPCDVSIADDMTQVFEKRNQIITGFGFGGAATLACVFGCKGIVQKQEPCNDQVAIAGL
tara:strand:- start:811 stop:996 length:186 start_codon:yes stop_codon:yes gene_type:complete